MMIDKTYLIGKRFGSLTVEKWIERRGQQSIWRCRCDCGFFTEVHYSALISGNTKSCGCLRGESHQMTKSREYKAWAKAKGRCYCKTDVKYRLYGARGIKMADAWKNSFSNFFADMGRCPVGKTLDRIDVNGNYEPGNCRWADASQQANNTRVVLRIFIPDVGEKTMTEIAKELHITRDKVRGVYERKGYQGVVELWSLFSA